MEGRPDQPDSERDIKRLPLKLIAVMIVAVLIIAAVAVIVWIPGETEAMTIAVASDSSSTMTGEEVSFTASTNKVGEVTNFHWNFGDGTIIDSGTLYQMTHAYSHPGSYLVIVSVENDQGKTNANWVTPVSIMVQTPESEDADNSSAPVPIVAATDDILENGTSVTFDATSSSGWSYETTPDGNPENYSILLDPSYVKSFSWDFGDGSDEVTGDVEDCGNTTHTYHGDGAIYPSRVNITSIHDTWEEFYTTIVILPSNVHESSGYVKNPDTYVVDQIGQPQTLDPAVCYEGVGGEIIQNVYETLIWYEGASAINLTPMLAMEVPTIENGGISQDGLNYTFHIRENVKFHSGNILTPEDVRYSFERVFRINDPSGPAWMLAQVLIPNYSWEWRPQENLGDIQKAVTIDSLDNSVTFHLQYQYPAFIYILAFTVGSVVEKNVVEAHGGIVDEQQNSWMNRNEAGSGPYTLKAWVQQQYIRMDAFDQYWRQPAKIKHVYINNVFNLGTREMHLFSGDADCVFIDGPHRSDVLNKPELKITEGAPTFGIGFIGMNQNIQPSELDIGDIPLDFFSDVHVRRAFTAAFDCDGFILNALYGAAIQPNGPIPKGMLCYNDSVPRYQFSIQKVREEMKLALDTRTSDPSDTYFDNGFRLTIFYLGDLVTQNAVDRLANGLKEALGDKVQIESQILDWGTAYIPALYSGQLSCAPMWWYPDYADPDDYITPFLLGGGSMAPLWGFDNTTLDEIIIQASREANQTTRAELYYEISMACYENAYYIWTDQSTQFHVERTWVHGYYFNPMYAGFYYYSFSKG